MKKFFSMMMIAAAFTFAACDNGSDEPDGPVKGGKLATPELTETHTETSITVSWGAIENAEAYRVNLKGKNYTTEELSYTLENLNAGEYTIRVMAMAEGYDDSDMAEITVTLTGATSVDWFTQTVSLSEVDEENGIYPYNSIDFIWKGTGVKDLRYVLFTTAEVEGLTDADIKKYLSDLGEGVNEILAEVNGDGFYGQFGGVLYAGTEYALYVEVTNNDGMKFFTVNEITTETFDIPAETQAWVGEWNAKTSQVVSMNVDEKGQIIYDMYAQEENFTFTISASALAPNLVVVDGLSVLGADKGFAATGYVEGNTLTILTNSYLGADSNSNSYYWLPCLSLDGQLYGINMFDGEVPSHVLTMAENGTVTATNGSFEVAYSDGTAANAVVVSTDVFVITSDGYLSFPGVETFPAVYRAGAMEVTKAAAPSAKALNKEAKNYSLTSTSIVLR